MRWLLICLTLSVAEPACADMTAVYEKPDKSFRMTIEVASNGDQRGEVAAKPGAYVLTLQGQCYAVSHPPTGLIVDRCEDAMAAAWAVVSERFPGMSKIMEEARKTKLSDKPFFRKGGEVTVQGRQGTAYYFANAPADKAQAVVVISSEPALAPLCAAVVTEFENSAAMSPISMLNPIADQMAAILKKGAPLMVAGAELTTVSRDPIDPTRFALPGPVESRETIIKRLRSTTTGTSVQAF